MEHIEDCISFLLGKAYQQVNQAAKRGLEVYGVTPVQFALLKLLWDQDGQSGAELGSRLQLDAATVTGMLDRLQNAGLIERRPDPKDRRINRLFLTTQGRQLQKPLEKVMDQINVEVYSRFTPADAEKLKAMLLNLGNVEVPA
ncbi:MAG TPA: MarR family transcriptional regulator [Chloroflexia bacterium]|nr:MarR family transcriptional regulator [Chloroflexia bacterium]